MRTILVGICMMMLASNAAAQQQPQMGRKVPVDMDDLLLLLDLPAYKAEFTLLRPAKAIQATLVVGSTDAAGRRTEQELKPGFGFQPPEAFTKYTVGVYVQKTKRQIWLNLSGVGSIYDMPAGFEWDYPTGNMRGVVDGNTILYAFEPKSPSAPVRSRSDAVRYFGVRVSLTE
jgi:hypothetical protein